MKNVSIEGQSFRESITAKPGETVLADLKGSDKHPEAIHGRFVRRPNCRLKDLTTRRSRRFRQTAETAKKAATEVKTLKGVFDVAKESIASGWAATFQVIFGDFEEAKKTFTDLSNAIQDIVGDAADARNKILEGWKELGRP